MNPRTQCLLMVLAVFFLDMLTPFFPVFGLLLLYIIWQRPPWFRNMVNSIYD